jgi:glycosyltransferase involved in cell wall biosynthesis
MLKNKKIAVVVPAYNEQLLIEKTLTTIPSYVDKIIVVEDYSQDRTKLIIKSLMKKNKKIILVEHEKNKGLGHSLITGYLKSLELEIDVIAVMAGDNQMDPNDLKKVVMPVIEGRVDYTKGNRLLEDDCVAKMPGYRFIGNSFLTLLTKFATGYWRIIDPQSGYTAISKKALSTIKIQDMIKGYGYNADILNMLNLSNFKVCDIAIRPVYGKEKSGIKVGRYAFKVGGLLTKLFLKRMIHKYLIREFHPLVFFYWFSFMNIILISLPLLIYMIVNLTTFPQIYFIIFAFSSMMGIFSFFFGMWMDMEDNRRLAR